VILPGFGAFIVTRQPVYFDEVSNMFFPSSREVCFNASISNNDGLIAHSIARREQVSYEEGCARMIAGVNSLKELLMLQGKVELPQIGILYMSKESRLSFEPYYTPLQRSAKFGEYPIDLSSYMNCHVSSGKDAEKNVESKLNRDKYYYIPIPKIVAKVAAVLAVVVVAAASLFVPGSNPQQGRDYASVIPIECISKTISSHIDVSERTESVGEQVVKPVADNQVREAISESNVTACEKPYQLIVATFKSKGEAERFIAQNKTDKYSLHVVASKTLYRVSAKGSESRDELLSLLNSTAFKNYFSEAWIYKI
jgi:hypothetical protein